MMFGPSNMGFQHKNLMSDPTNETSQHYCKACYQDCSAAQIACVMFCPTICSLPDSPPNIYPPPPPPPAFPEKTEKLPMLMVLLTIFTVALMVLACFGCYVKWFSRRRRRRSSSSSLPETAETRYQDHGPIVYDHSIWYINTGGLQPCMVRSIAVRKYKRGEGVVEGTDCSVCLNEFKEDESVRQLPKCNHAFHIPCIDTWLKSHTTCPMCRAPIVLNHDIVDDDKKGPSTSSDVNNEELSASEETQVVIVEDDKDQFVSVGYSG